MSMVGFPLLLIPFAIYNIIAFLMPSVSFDVTLAKLTLVSGAEWPITLSDVLLTLGILLLLLEVMKSARPGGKYITDHLLSFLVLGATAAEFVMWQKFGTSTFFLLVLMAMVDFFAGVALRGRRAVAQPASRTAVARREPGKVREDAKQDEKTMPVEPHVEPDPAPAAEPAASAPASEAPATTSAVPAAASVAESVLMDRPEPKPVRPEAIRPVVLAPEPKPAAPAVEVAPPAPESQPAPAVKAEHIEAEEIKETEAREIAAQEIEAQKIEAQAAPAAAEPSPQGSSGELHPGGSPPASPETPKH